MKCFLSFNNIFLILTFCFLLKCDTKENSKSNLQAKQADIVEFKTPVIVKSISKLPPPPQIIYESPKVCGCAKYVKCQPCGVVINKIEMPECPCAPKLQCPVCPPVSIIHEMAAKKALHDQKLAYNLRGLSSKINNLLESIMKYSGDVVKFEMKAKEMAQKMEESSLKANFARSNMIKVILHDITNS